MLNFKDALLKNKTILFSNKIIHELSLNNNFNLETKILYNNKYFNFLYKLNDFLKNFPKFKNVNIFGGFIVNTILYSLGYHKLDSSSYFENSDIDINIYKYGFTDIRYNDEKQFLENLNNFMLNNGFKKIDENNDSFVIKYINEENELKIDFVKEPYGNKLCFLPNLFTINLNNYIKLIRENSNLKDLILQLDIMNNSKKNKLNIAKDGLNQLFYRYIIFNHNIYENSYIYFCNPMLYQNYIFDIKRVYKMFKKGFTIKGNHNFVFFDKNKEEKTCYYTFNSSHENGGDLFIKKKCNINDNCNQWICLEGYINVLENYDINNTTITNWRCPCGFKCMYFNELF
jgi:hypothetical protein